ncbi:MAG TPA: DNA polymerase III subunit gamma/tau, partial [Patescibacteria group bacterium]|nr:DNA polymerase III subunit gamma/tau [Patescibacteria group bacterium]
TGPRGVGKTSVARILAHEVNGLPYDEDATHLDIIEIDAASNRRIDEIRELRDRVHNAPTSAKYKVYIIDEVHMLTREAFNALLKTLEEPPAHAIFILATTEAHKLPDTIVSRTQRFSFKPIEVEAAISHLRSLAKSEEIDIEDGALRLIAEHSGGSFRDGIGLLEQVAASGKSASTQDVVNTLGIASNEAINNLREALFSGTPAQTIATLDKLYEQGYHPGQLAKQLASSLRQDLLQNSLPFEHSLLLEILSKLLLVNNSHEPAIALELAILGAVLERSDLNPAVPAKAERPIGEARNEATKPEPQAKKPKEPIRRTEPAENRKDGDLWSDVLTAIKEKHNTLYSLARMAAYDFKDGELVLSFGFPFHQKRLNDIKNRTIIEEIIKDLSGKDIKITCVVDKSQKVAPVMPKPELKPTDSTALGSISNIFGNVEMLD